MVKNKKAGFVWPSLGNEKQKQFLEILFMNGKLGHAYLFVGPDNVGKTALALDFARILVCLGRGARPCGECAACRLPVGANPDIVLVEGDPITVAVIRKLQNDFALKSFHAGRRAAVIAGAHLLNLEAANALLKFLEEPDFSTVIILTAPSLAVPETVLSRVQKIFFSPADGPELEGYLSHSPLPKSRLKKLVASAYGRLGLVRRAEQDEVFRDNWLAEEQAFERLLQASLFERLLQASDLASRESAELKAIFLHWLLAAESRLASGTEIRGIKAEAQTARSLTDALIGLEFNANKKLLLDNLVINLPERSR